MTSAKLCSETHITSDQEWPGLMRNNSKRSLLARRWRGDLEMAQSWQPWTNRKWNLPTSDATPLAPAWSQEAPACWCHIFDPPGRIEELKNAHGFNLGGLQWCWESRTPVPEAEASKHCSSLICTPSGLILYLKNWIDSRWNSHFFSLRNR